MRKWTKSACVVIAWSILPILVVIGTRGPDRPAQAGTTNASSISKATLTDAPGILTPSDEAAPAVAPPAATWVVRPGDTLSTIASALRVPGGWQALYAANRRLIGPDPNIISAGTRLNLPGLGRQARYTVTAGDTLSGIASALSVSGGWQALYAANRRLIGPDPDAISAGTTLTVPRPATGKPAAGKPATGNPATGNPMASPPTAGRPRISRIQTVPAGNPPQPVTSWAADLMPGWLKLTLLIAALLITLAFIIEPVAALARRRGRTARPGGARLTAGRTRTAAGGTGSDRPGSHATAAWERRARPAACPGTGPSGPASGPACGPRDADASPAAPGGTAVTPVAAPAPSAPGGPAAPAAGADGPAATPGGTDEAGAAQPRDRRLRGVQDAPDGPGAPDAPDGPGERDPGESAAVQAARIVQAEHERLVVTYSVRDHTVYLLTPPGEDPRTVLRAARLVVPEHAYQELAGHLGIAPGWRLL